MGRFNLTTKRLLIRPLTESDREELRVKIFAHPACVKTMTGDASTPEKQRELVEEWYSNYAGTWNSHGYGLWGVFRSDETYRMPEGLLGIIWIQRPREDDPEEWLEIGYAITPNAWGYGVVTEAALAVLDFVFESTTAQGVDALIFSELNPASVRVVEKLGGDFIGRFSMEKYMGTARMEATHNMDLWILEYAGGRQTAGEGSVIAFIKDACFRTGQFVAEGMLSREQALEKIEAALDSNKTIKRSADIDKLIQTSLNSGIDAPGWAQYRIHRETWNESRNSAVDKAI